MTVKRSEYSSSPEHGIMPPSSRKYSANGRIPPAAVFQSHSTSDPRRHHHCRLMRQFSLLTSLGLSRWHFHNDSRFIQAIEHTRRISRIYTQAVAPTGSTGIPLSHRNIPRFATPSFQRFAINSVGSHCLHFHCTTSAGRRRYEAWVKVPTRW